MPQKQPPAMTAVLSPVAASGASTCGSGSVTARPLAEANLSVIATTAIRQRATNAPLIIRLDMAPPRERRLHSLYVAGAARSNEIVQEDTSPWLSAFGSRDRLPE